MSTYLVTKNIIRQIFEDIATQHYQINSFGYGDDSDYTLKLMDEDTQSLEGNIVYPRLFLSPDVSRIQTGSYYRNYVVIVADLIRTGDQNFTEVESDTEQILLDVIAQIQDQDYGFVLDESSIEITPFKDRFADKVTGHMATISLECDYEYNRCQIPTEFIAVSNPYVPVTNGSNERDPLSWHLAGNSLDYEGFLGTTSNQAFKIGTNGVVHWRVETDGTISPEASADIGTASNRVGTLYVDTLNYNTLDPAVIDTGIVSLNGLTDTTQLFALGSSGTNPNIVSVGDTHTFNFPLAGVGITSGTISNASQSLDGIKTFNDGLVTDYVQLDTTATPTPSKGMIFWDNDEETAAVRVNGIDYELGQGLYWVVKNQTGSQINKGTAVYAAGTLGASSRILVEPMIADRSIEAKYFLGIAAEDIADGDDGKVITQGKVRQIDTTAYNDGDVLWVSPTTAGDLTNVEPTGNNLALAVAFVVHAASNGVIAARVSNLNENDLIAIKSLNGLTDATQLFAVGSSGTTPNISSIGDTHTFNFPLAGSGITSGTISDGAQTIVGAKTFSSAPILSGFTQGSVLFTGAGGVVSEDNIGIFYDAVNDFTGLGTNTPKRRLHVVGPSMMIGDSAANNTLKFFEILAESYDTAAQPMMVARTFTNASSSSIQWGGASGSPTRIPQEMRWLVGAFGDTGNTANAVKLRIDSNGSVVIANAAQSITPAAKLHVQGSGTTSATNALLVQNNAATQLFKVADDGLVSVNTLAISTITNAITDTDKFLVSDSGVIKYRTGAEVRSDIGAGTGDGTVTSVALAAGTTGTDVNITGSPITGSGTITLNIPDASATARGLVTTGAQTIAGQKTFSSAPILSGFTQGSVLFAGAGGVVSEDAGVFNYDPTNKTFNVGSLSNSNTSIQLVSSSFSVDNTKGLVFTRGSSSFNFVNTGTLDLVRSGSVITRWNTDFNFSVVNSLNVGKLGTPSARLDVRGSGVTSSTYTAQFHNSTGTSNSLVIRDDGKVGIGTNTPVGFLELNGANVGLGLRLIRGSSDFAISGDSTLFNVGTISNSVFRFVINNSEVGRWTTAGNFLIGNTTGTARLQVKGSGTTSATNALLVQNSATTNLYQLQDDGRHLFNAFLSGETSSDFVFRRKTGSSGNIAEFISSTDAYTRITTTNAAGLSFLIFKNTATANFTWASGRLNNNNFAIRGWTGSDFGVGTTLRALVFDTSGAAVFNADVVNASAQVQIDSTTKGFLPPRMTTAQKNAIASPAAGLMVYDTTLNKLCVYTTAWETITSV